MLPHLVLRIGCQKPDCSETHVFDRFFQKKTEELFPEFSLHLRTPNDHRGMHPRSQYSVQVVLCHCNCNLLALSRVETRSWFSATKKLAPSFGP